ncbi:hypothetical protein C4K38_4491 [Pseudomonas chlororaphis subsp. piscium]|uniref:hypothetical protein n=1 Tax=Pseudomonas chlororaphis TaxID=587753 RepID=UPI00087CE0F7|nr:hypothetical protein [Pseudomonas chlororaphis]AZC32442.1 hypothetical protein C4K38_4491 [Pseudomonas chlororaphis subsp. piscium]WDG90156.1 hypothetical protein PUP49_23115 [Pseudomonas chlororaphis]SDS63785.1 hypothetical protein SAMN05216585_2901 [Pseudomonas chlororaphis]
MTKYKRLSVALGLVFLVLSSRSLLAADQQCQLKAPNKKLEIASCQNESGVVILKLIPSGLSPYATDLEKLPTFIVSGESREDVMKEVGMRADITSAYSRLIVLPYPEAIIEFSNASKAARLKVAQKGWRLLDMKNVVYSGSGGGEGVGLICSTLEKETRKGVVVVSQCNDFYESDVLSLKEILESVDE